MKLPTITSGSNFVDGYVGVGKVPVDSVDGLPEAIAKQDKLHTEAAEAMMLLAQLLAQQGNKNEATSKAILTLVETSNNALRSKLDGYTTWNNHRTRLMMNMANNTAEGVSLSLQAINQLMELTFWQRIKWMLFGKAPFKIIIEQDTLFDIQYSEDASTQEQLAKERSDDSTL